MSDRSCIIRHRDHDIVYLDYSSLNDAEDLRRRIIKALKLERKLGNSGILEIVDVTGSFADIGMLEILKESAMETAGMLQKVAVIGVSEVKKVFLEVVKEFSGIRAEAFASLDEAKDWLAKD
jgi:hypothetical protein